MKAGGVKRNKAGNISYAALPNVLYRLDDPIILPYAQHGVKTLRSGPILPMKRIIASNGFRQSSAMLDFEVGAGRLASERVLEHGSDRDASQRGADGRAVPAVGRLDGSEGLADGHDVLARDFGQASLTQIGRLAPYRLAGSGKEFDALRAAVSHNRPFSKSLSQ
jgi:hypothetical protein